MGVFFVGTYITYLVRGLGLVEAVRGIEKMSSPRPLGLAILRAMGMIRRRGISGYALITDLEEKYEEERDVPKDSPVAPSESPPTTIPRETETDTPPLAKPEQPYTQARD